MNMKIAHRSIFGRILPIAALLGLLGAPEFGVGRPDPDTESGYSSLPANAPSARVVVRFSENSGLIMNMAGLYTSQAAKNTIQAQDSRRRILALINSQAPAGRLEARLPTAVAAANKRGTADSFAALARYAHFAAGTDDPGELAQLVARLQADPAVDLAWVEPVATPATLDFGQPAFPATGADGAASAASAATADFEYLQGYLADAPLGVGALSMRAQPGARGAGITVVDVEGGWLWSHEDLTTPAVSIGQQVDDLGWRNHGTAVLGVIRGQDNGLGVTGITPDCAVGQSSIGSQATSEAILAAGAVLSPGDVIVIELHAAGPEATGVGQEGFVPMEFWQDNFDAIAAVTRRGILVVEAAGNGQVDLDAPIYEGLFDPAQRHSGAIMIGATDGAALAPAWFTNHGQRVDLNGWGFNVTTLAYGDLQGLPDLPEELWYTAAFNGTSSATPVVTGAVVALNGMVRERFGFDLDARLARDLLRATGTPTTGTRLIGTRPDLVAAFAMADTSIGEIRGVVTELGSGLPLPGVLVTAAGGATTATAADGSWRLPLVTGPVDLAFSRFGYGPEQAAVLVTLGGTVFADVSLAALARIDITGIVYGNGQPLPGAVVAPTLLPLTMTTTDGSGAFTIHEVPVQQTDNLLIYGVPGFGVRIVPVSTFDAIGSLNISPALTAIGEDFSLGGGGFTAIGGLWSHGAPPVDVPGAFTGPFCWGIGMDGQGYADDQADTLTSPVYSLAGVSAGPYFLSFHYFSATEANYDGVNLAVSTGGPFTLMTPLEGYSDLFLGGLGQQAGWSGASAGWTGTVFDIGALTGGEFRFRLSFGSDGGVTAPGFFVDGITFGRGLSATGVSDDPPAVAAAGLGVWPNPFNPRLNVSYTLTRPGTLTVAVYDVRGHRVRRLFNAPVSDLAGVLQWDGRDDSGRAAASGVYLVRMQGPDGQSASQRVVLAR